MLDRRAPRMQLSKTGAVCRRQYCPACIAICCNALLQIGSGFCMEFIYPWGHCRCLVDIIVCTRCLHPAMHAQL